MRESWTDGRLDDFAANVDRRFDQVDRRFDRVEADIRDLRSELNLRLDGMQHSLDGMHGRLDAMQRTMIVGFAGIVASIVGSALAAILASAH